MTQAEIDAGGNLFEHGHGRLGRVGARHRHAQHPDRAGPALAVVKTSTTIAITAAGQVVPYTFTVTNTGNLTLTGVTVTDPKCSGRDQRPDRRHQHRRQAADHRDLDLHAARTPSRQAEIDAGGNLSNTVTVDSAESAPDTDTINIPIAQAPR